MPDRIGRLHSAATNPRPPYCSPTGGARHPGAVRVDVRAIHAIHAKVERADQHFREIAQGMLEWSSDQPYRLVQSMSDGGTRHLFRLQLTKPIPVDWAVLLGEALHDLRSALEQSVYWLIVDWSKKPPRRSGFPVFRTRPAFQSQGAGLIKGIGPGPAAFIEWLQPYPQRSNRAPTVAVRTAHDLWNQDKHRLVHLWGMRFSEHPPGSHWRLAAASPPTDCQPWIDRRVRHEGEIVLQIRCKSRHPDVRFVDGAFKADLVIAAGKFARGGNRSVWDLERLVGDVVNKLLRALEQQARPINTSSWTYGAPYPYPGA